MSNIIPKFIIIAILIILGIVGLRLEKSTISGDLKAYGLDKLANNRTNIVVILADDLGWNDVGYHGSEIKTPNLDKLAQSSVRLEQFYVKPSCTPTRASMLTGRHAFRYGMASSVVKPWDKKGLPLEEETVAQTLKQAGYYTAIVGKWHLGHYEKAYLPTERGFDYHYGHYCGGINYFTHELDSWIQGGLDWHRNEVPVIVEGYSTDLISQEATRLIYNHNYQQSPLFLYVSFNAPHTPLQAKDRDLTSYSFIKDQKRRIFAAQVQSMDEAIGNIIKTLKDQQIWDNTLLIFTSDNGGSTFSADTRSDNSPLRGQKGTLYEGGVRVPTILSYPAKFRESQVSNLNFSIVDLYPTFINLAKVKPLSKNKLDGIDIIDALKKGSTGRDELLIEYSAPSAGAIIKGDYKLIKNSMYAFDVVPYYGTVELFNLKEDPLENHNLADTQPDKVEEIQKLLSAYAKDAKPSVLKTSKEIPPNFVIPKVWSPEYIQQAQSTRKTFKKTNFKYLLKTMPKTWIAAVAFLIGILFSYFLILVWPRIKIQKSLSSIYRKREGGI